MLDHHRALIYTMVIVSAADSDMPDAELRIIGDIVQDLPIFDGFDQRELPRILNDCTELMARENGFEQTLKAIKTALPAKLRETAYVIACDLVAVDGAASEEELRILELIRDRLNIDRLIAAAIERAARARFQTL
jgi:tellurite resistance protein